MTWADVFGDRSPPCGGNVEHMTVTCTSLDGSELNVEIKIYIYLKISIYIEKLYRNLYSIFIQKKQHYMSLIACPWLRKSNSTNNM